MLGSLLLPLPPFLPVRSEGSATPFHPMSSAPFGGPTAIASSFSDTQETSKLNSEYQRIIAALLPVEILSNQPTVTLPKSMQS